MRIAYLCEFDAANIDVMSGYPHAFLTQFERLGHEVIRVFPLSRHRTHWFFPHRLFYKAVGRTYRPDREIAYLRSLARQAERRLETENYDLVFAPGSHLVAEINVPKPTVFCADASFASVVDRYSDFSNCSERFRRLGHRQDQRAHDRCAAALYPSEAFASEAAVSYGVKPSKLHAVPWGSNFESLPADSVRDAIRERTGVPLRILFVGKDWKRKGADIVVATCERLVERGIDLRLDLVGISDPPAGLPSFVTVHGLLSKRVQSEYERLVQLLLRADVFFVPSRAENYGLVFCEAAAFGVPVVSSAVGGIPTIVRDDVNGYLLTAEAGPDEFAKLIQDRLLDRERRQALSCSALADFGGRLTWDSFGRSLNGILEQIVGAAS